MNPEVKRITTSDSEYTAMLRLRDEVLRRPLGMSVYDDDLEQDQKDTMLVAIDAGEVIGCTMLKPVQPGVLKLRQMAVSATRQGRGIGRLLVLEAERSAAAAGYRIIELHARQTAVPFYESLGYAAEGPIFSEVGIPHRLMKKQIA